MAESLGVRFCKFCQGLYYDDHEPDDVVHYQTEFLQRMSQYERRMLQYSGGNFMEEETDPYLRKDERRLVLVTHDESFFGSNDGSNFVWIDENYRQIRPKRKRSQRNGIGISVRMSWPSEIDT